MERTLAPIGVASMRFTRASPAASAERTWAGSAPPAMAARRPGMRLSSTSVVLPLPETPVTAVSRPRGTSTASGRTVWMAPVSRRTAPRAKTSAAAARSRTRTRRSPVRNGAIREPGSFSTLATGPCAMTRPPSAPEPGPISTSQSAWRSTRTSWSTSTTELPSARRSSTTPSSPSTLEGCSPMEGSSST